MGGAGKTTLAKELFNRYKSHYNKSSFLFDVREADVTNQLPCLQCKLLKELFDKDPSFRSIEEGMSYLKDNLDRSTQLNSLIVVDDIDHVKQLSALLIMHILRKSNNCLVIVTTRDEGVLINAGITDRYCLEGMERDDGRELFCWHAFDQSIPHRGYEAMVDAFMSVCGGLPLSLQVLGRHVRGRTKDYWHSELTKVSKMLHRDVKQSLRISFDSLDDEEKQVFMDVACFFVGKPTDLAEKILEGSGWNALNAIQTLRDKCLIEKEVRGYEYHRRQLRMPHHLIYQRPQLRTYDHLIYQRLKLRMHDHLRDLGREMALEHSPPHRLWRPQDLKSLESMGFKSILAETDVRCSHSIFDESMGFKVTFFLGQSNNRFQKSGSLLWLELHGVDSSWIHNQNFQYFPGLRQSDDQLKEIKFGELPSIPSWIPLQNLQFLKITKGRLKSLWSNCIQAPSQLKKLQISQTSLSEFPVLFGISKDSLENGGNSGSVSAPVSGLEELEIDVNGETHVSKILISGIHYPSLRSIILCGMENLMEVNLTRVETLKHLEIRNCKKLQTVVATSICLKVIIEDCNHLKSVSGLPNLASLAEIVICHCSQLVFENLTLSGMNCLRRIEFENIKVNYFELDSCQNLTTLNFDCKELEELRIRGCPKLEHLPFLRGLAYLERIIIDGCGKFKCLKLDRCENLKSVSANFENSWLDISHSLKPKELSDLATISGLEKIEINHCEKIQNIMLPTTLVGLSLQSCRDLQQVEGTGELMELRELFILDCPKIEGLPSLSKVSYMYNIEIKHCEKIQSITLPATLFLLSVQSCRDLQTIARTGDLTKITVLIIKQCPALEVLPIFDRVSCLEHIEIGSYEEPQNIVLPKTIIRLSVQSCRDLQRIEVASDLTKLRKLIIKQCPALEVLPIFDRVSCLERIEIGSCEKLQNIVLPKTIISLSVQSCRDLQRIEVAGDLTKLRKLISNQCPALEVLPIFDRVSCSERIEIGSCQKLQNIVLPKTIISLSVQSCRDLQRIEVAGDLTELTELIIQQCPVLEGLPSLARLSCLKHIEIDSCEMLQNIPGIEDWHVSGWMSLSYCSNAVIWNFIHNLKSLPLAVMYMIGRAVEGAESSLNKYLFADANMGLDQVIEIATDQTYLEWCLICSFRWPELTAVIVCLVVVVDGSTSIEDINQSLSYPYTHDHAEASPKFSEGKWMITMVARDLRHLFQFGKIADALRRHGTVKKAFRVEVKDGQEWKSVIVLRRIVDALYHL